LQRYLEGMLAVSSVVDHRMLVEMLLGDKLMVDEDLGPQRVFGLYHTMATNSRRKRRRPSVRWQRRTSGLRLRLEFVADVQSNQILSIISESSNCIATDVAGRRATSSEISKKHDKSRKKNHFMIRRTSVATKLDDPLMIEKTANYRDANGNRMSYVLGVRTEVSVCVLGLRPSCNWSNTRCGSRSWSTINLSSNSIATNVRRSTADETASKPSRYRCKSSGSRPSTAAMGASFCAGSRSGILRSYGWATANTDRKNTSISSSSSDDIPAEHRAARQQVQANVATINRNDSGLSEFIILYQNQILFIYVTQILCRTYPIRLRPQCALFAVYWTIVNIGSYIL